MKKNTRSLTVENLEQRVVLDGVGLDAAVAGPDWESVIVAVNDNVGDPGAIARGIAAAHGGRLGHVYEHALKGFSAQLPESALDALAKDPLVKRIEPDLEMRAFNTELENAELEASTGVNRIQADLNPVANIDGIDEIDDRVDIDVAIIDSGIDVDHEDLNVVGGQRFYTISTGPPHQRGTFGDDQYDDDNGHGTHVAGIVGALDNGVGVVGVAPGARLHAVKVLDANGYGDLSDIIAGIDWVTDNAATIEIANMSLGGTGSSTSYREAIQNSVNAGVVYVVASGNEYADILGDHTFGNSDDTIPAAYPEVATISAIADFDGKPGGESTETATGPAGETYYDDTFADFSNYSNSDDSGNSWYDTNNPVTSPGLGIDLMMPGVDIYSTYMGGGYATGSGTSMAAPHAAGLAALYVAEHGRDVNGDSAVNQDDVYAIRQALIDGGVGWRTYEGLGYLDPTVDNPDSPDKHEENLGWAGVSDLAPSVTITEPADGATVSGSVDVSANATDDDGVTQVEFFVDEVSIGVDSDSTDGWSLTWDTTAYADRSHTIEATATDTASNTATDSVSVTVDNVDDAPTVSITNPSDGATVSGSVDVSANAADDDGVTQVEFFVDEVSIGVDSDSTDGWSLTWDTTAYADGSQHSISAIATDTAGQTATDTVSATVDNSQVATMHVENLEGSTHVMGRSGKWEALVTVTIVDKNDNPLSGATVSGDWSVGEEVIGSAEGTTAEDGTYTFTSPELRHPNVTSVTFTVTDVWHESYTYDGSANVESTITMSYDGTSSTNGQNSANFNATLDQLYWLLAQDDDDDEDEADGEDPAPELVDYLFMQDL